MSPKKIHTDEVSTDVALVQTLIKQQFPHWANLPIKPVHSAGTDNALYRLGSELVVRLPRIEWAVEDVAKEQTWLPKLAPQLPFAVPTPVAMGAPGFGYPWHWSIYRWLEGENPKVENLENPRLLAKDLAKFIKSLHQIDPTGGPTASRGVPLAMRDAPTRKAIEELHGLINVPAVTEVWDAALKIPEWKDNPVWVHGDISPGNLLLKNGRLSAVIDFGGLGVGNPACDLIVAWNLLPADAKAVFREALDVDDATWARGRGWALSIALIQLPYYQHSNPALAANARHVIHEVLTDQS